MKKLFLLGLTVLTIKLSSAQVLFGIRGGLNISNSSWTYGGMSDSDKKAARFHIGGLAEIPVSESFFVQPELLLNQYGGKEDNQDDRITMLSLPLLARFKASAFSFYAGPQYDLLLSAKYFVSGSTIDATEYFRKHLLSGTLGAEYTFEGGVSIGARYQKSLANAVGDDFYLTGYKATYNTISISATYMFGNRD